MKEYNELLSKLEDSVRGAHGPVLVAGDFNAKRPEWGSQISNARGNALAELSSALDLHVCNVGGRPTFTRERSESFIHITFVSRSLWINVCNWRVLYQESMILHWYITFDISATTFIPVHPAPKGWRWPKLDREKLRTFLETKAVT